jgi:AbrB family looped-hinge helix DNA binding protein
MVYYQPEGLRQGGGGQMKNDIATVTSKGQLVIPSRLRRRYGIRQGTQVVFREENNKLILQPLTPEFIRSLRGSLKGDRSPLKLLLEDRKRERRL